MIGGQRIVAVVQARMGSTRLPGKVLMPLAGRSVLWHVVHRLSTLELFDEIVVATSTRCEDDGIVAEVESLPFDTVRCFRGPEQDVLERFYLALCDRPPSVVARVTADSPLVCAEHLRRMVHHLLARALDGVDAHFEKTGLTLGFGSEVYDYRALRDAHLLASRPEDREHVTLFIKRRPRVFHVEYPRAAPDLCSEFRLTLDYPEDYGLLSRLYDELYRSGQIVDCRQALQWLRRHPRMARVNAHCRQVSA